MGSSMFDQAKHEVFTSLSGQKSREQTITMTEAPQKIKPRTPFANLKDDKLA